jgi:hypothetical protein
MTNLLDFIDYCNEVIDIHPSNTPQYKCAMKSLVHAFHLMSILASKEESRDLSDILQQERTVTNIIDLFHKVAQVKNPLLAARRSMLYLGTG